MTVATNRQNTSIVLVEVVTVAVAVLISSVIAVAGSDQRAFANKDEGNKNGQKISQSDGSIHYIIICQTTGTNSPITDHSCNNQLTSTKTNSGVSTGYVPVKKNYGQKISQSDGSIHYIIICETTGTNSPITDHSCNNQLADGNGVPMIIPLVFG